MWFLSKFPDATCVMVEPDENNLNVGMQNLSNNGLKAEFIKAFVSAEAFSIDNFLESRKDLSSIILHSDIQGFELEMLQSAERSLDSQTVKWAFISTHSAELHSSCLAFLRDSQYHIDVDSEPLEHSTSYDGFILARADSEPYFLGSDFSPMGRSEVLKSKPSEIIEQLSSWTRLLGQRTAV